MLSRVFLRSTIIKPRFSRTLVYNRNYCTPTETNNKENVEDEISFIDHRGYEDEFYKRFQYLGRHTEGKMGLADYIQEVYEQLDELTDKGKHGLVDEAHIDEDKLMFTLEGKPYVTESFFDMEPVKKKHLPEGWPGRIDEYEFEWIGKKETMCRTVYSDVMKLLKEQKDNGFLASKGTKPIFLDGLNGTGKSVGLSHIVLYARAEGWLVLYVPNAYKLVSNYRIKPSKTRKWVYDLHEGAVEIMQGFRDSHHKKLQKIKMKGTLPRIDELEAFNSSQTEETTLLDLVDFGLTCDNPSEVFVALRNELTSVIEYPVLIAVDDINCLQGNSGFMKPIHLREEKISWADCSEISVINAINRPDEAVLINGNTISAVTSQRTMKSFDKVMGDTFRENAITVPHYSFDEYRQRVAKYVASGDLESIPSILTEEYIYQLCSGRPKHVASYYATII